MNNNIISKLDGMNLSFQQKNQLINVIEEVISSQKKDEYLIEILYNSIYYNVDGTRFLWSKQNNNIVLNSGNNTWVYNRLKDKDVKILYYYNNEDYYIVTPLASTFKVLSETTKQATARHLIVDPVEQIQIGITIT